jgi:transcriptional regulator with PAS, ATPase and Fis domain
MNTLVAWIGMKDLAGIGQSDEDEQGPIARALRAIEFKQLMLLGNNEAELHRYIDWLNSWTQIPVASYLTELSDPTDHRGIYHCATGAVDMILKADPETELTFHLSPGTPQMSQIWLLLARTQYSARIIQSTREHGVVEPDVPFAISAEFLPRVFETADSRLQRAITEIPPEGATFGDIFYRSAVMAETIRRAEKAATRNLPIVIQGESGTGKDLLARAIHNHSRRYAEPFLAINCGAIPKDLVESELFGSATGAYSGATDRTGYFEAADGGTLLLDEVGDLPLDAQVKLLRALQEGAITRVGSTESRRVDVRIIAATHFDLFDAVANDKFREDLLYRLVGMTLNLPPLRERKGDVGFLADRLLEQINQEAIREEPGFRSKSLSADAKNVIIKHSWPGNVRELRSTLRRAAIWSDARKLSGEDIQRELLPVVHKKQTQDQILNRRFYDGFEIESVMAEVAKHYLSRALKETGKNKSKVARLLGLGSYQTVSNWMEKYELDV